VTDVGAPRDGSELRARDLPGVPGVEGVTADSGRFTADGPVVAVRLSPVSATMTIDQLAEAFAGMSDEHQAEFLVRVAARFAEFSARPADWRRGEGPSLGGDYQALMIGERLGRRPDGAAAVELLRLVMEAAEEALVGEVMGS
jgi:hypothetical protein